MFFLYFYGTIGLLLVVYTLVERKRLRYFRRISKRKQELKEAQKTVQQHNYCYCKECTL